VSVRRPASILALALVFLAAPLAARAAKLPDWAAPIAAEAPEVPSETSDIAYRVLFREDRLTVVPGGSFLLRRRLATQSLTNRFADEAGAAGFHFNEGAKVSKPRAWHLPPGEKAQRGHGQPVDLTLDDSFLTDNRTRMVALEGVKRGSIVFFEFEAEEVPPVLSYSDMFFENAPTTRSRFEVEAPPGWSLRHAWLAVSGPEPTVTGGVTAWEIRDLPWAEREPLGDDPRAQAPWLVVALDPPASEKVKSVPVPDWGAFSVWYDRISEGRDAATPEVKAAAQTAYAGAGDGLFPRALAAATYVRDRVRYIAKEIGIGSFQPRPAQKVAVDLYGDCKDKATLYRSILSVGGIASHPVLVHATLDATVAPDIPEVGAFNHAVAAVVIPAGTEVPERFADAVVDAGDLGKLLIVDTTAELVSPGDLPDYLEGKKALVVAGPRGRVVTLPAGTPASHRVERKVTTTRIDDATWAVKLESTYTGAPATEERVLERQSSLDRRKETERALLHVWPDAVVESYATKFETPEGAFTESVALRVPATGDVHVFPLSNAHLERVSLTKRRGAVDFGYPRTIRMEASIAADVATGVAPKDFDSTGSGWTATGRFTQDAAGLHAVETVAISKARFEPEAFPDLKKLWATLGKTPMLRRGAAPAEP